MFLLLDRHRHLLLAMDTVSCMITDDNNWNLQMHCNVYAFLSLMFLLWSAYLMSNSAHCNMRRKIKSNDTSTALFGCRLRTLITICTILIASASLPSVAFGYEVRTNVFQQRISFSHPSLFITYPTRMAWSPKLMERQAQLILMERNSKLAKM